MNTPHEKTPPKWIQSLLRRFASEESLEEIEGDLLEFYGQWVQSKGKTTANLKYFITAITLLRPFRKSLKELINTTFFIMIRSYFIMSWRTIVKNKVSSIINLSGLTLGLTTSLLILLVVLVEFEYDQQHIKKETLFLMMKNQKTNDGISTGRSTAGPMAETLKSDYPQVARAARVAGFDDVPVMVNDAKSMESGIYADPDLFRMMTFNVIAGNPGTALDGNSVVITKSMAEKLFVGTDPIGKIMVFDGQNAMTVGAVIDDISESNSVRFGMAVPFKVLEKHNDWLTKWDDNRIQTWVELNSANDLAQFNQQVAPLIHQKTGDVNETVFAYALTELHLHGGFSNGQPSGGAITFVYLLGGFGVFMLLIACVNFMNIATAQSAHRAREVGVRKVLGAARRWIVFQFLNEALVITFIALAASVVIAILIIPSFNTIMHASISFEFDKTIVWILIFSVALATALLAGSYPAFVLSRFSPARVLKGMIDHPGGLSIRRVLVTFQFVISISVLVGTIILYAEVDFIKSRPMGYEQENLIDIPLDSLATAKFASLKNEVLKIPGVAAVTGSGGNILYSGGAITGMDWPGKKPGEDLSVVIADVEYDWSHTMGIEMISGRDFSAEFKSDEIGCLLNQSAVDKMGLVNPVGSVVGGHPVIGVFRNFVYNNPSGMISPMAVYLAPARVHHLYARVDNNDSWTTTIRSIEKTVKQVSPDLTFEPRFTKEEYQSRFEEFSDIGLMTSVFGGMTIFISCLGLFGLSGFIADRRGKEMSIRKVFGADNIRVLLSLTTDIVKPVVVALVIVIPLSIWIAGMVLDRIVYRVPLSWWMFGKAILLVMGVAILIVFYHGWRTASESPSVRLKSE